MVRTLPLDSESRPQLPRILAIAVAIALHALAFLLLLVPMAVQPVDTKEASPKPSIEWVVPEIPPVVEPLVTPVVQRQPPRTQTPPVITPDVATPPSDTVIVDNGTLPADPIPYAPAGDPTPNLGVPLSGVQLEYAVASPPPYPRGAIREGLQGQVMLKILVGTDGKPLDVQVETSSGHRILDKAARDFVLKNWQFKPAMRDGQPVQAYGMVPINFSMQ